MVSYSTWICPESVFGLLLRDPQLISAQMRYKISPVTSQSISSQSSSPKGAMIRRCTTSAGSAQYEEAAELLVVHASFFLSLPKANNHG